MSRVRRASDLVTIPLRTLYALAAAVAVVGLAGGAILGAAVARSRGEAVAQDGPSGRDAGGEPALPGRGAAPLQIQTAGRPTLGPSDAAVTIVEFTDYDCPFCRRHYQQTFTRLMAAYGDRVRYVVRHFPLVSLHPDAAKAAEAAECANRQGLFWEYHDFLLRQATVLDAPSLKRYATEVGVDTDGFDRCLDEGASAAAVQEDLREGFRNGVRGTPSFFINDQFLSGAVPYEAFAAYVDAALDRPNP